jgi:alkylation response protein AidB-like acyl-CoA dehydrogenase
LDAVRGYADGDKGLPEKLAAALTELGVSGAMVAEEHGGSAMGLVEAALIAEALGGAVSPAGFIGNALAAMAIAASPDHTQYLPGIADGSVRFGAALTEAVGARDGAGITAAGGTLNGTALFALDCDGATHILIASQDQMLHIAAVNAPGLSLKPLRTIDRSRTLTEVTFTDTPATPLSDEPALTARIIAAGRLLLAADSLGAAQHMLKAAVDYAGTREQFGRVIGSFQAVKHMCAEMAAKLEPCRALIWHAAYALQHGEEEGELLATLAKAHLSEVAPFVARTATEVHGGMGFTDLLGLHYWFKRIGVNRQLLGGPEKVRADAARMQGLA